MRGRALDDVGAVTLLPNSTKLRILIGIFLESVREGQASRAKGEQPRPSVKVPKCMLSGKGCEIAQTPRRLA